MSKSRRANSVLFGFDFQVNAAIILMLDNIDELSSLKLEGNYEDIEIKLDSDQYILAQAKAIVNSSSDYRNVRTNLKKSLSSLSDGCKGINVKELIMITNSPNPLNELSSQNLFWGMAHRSYSSLPKSSQKLINLYLNKIETPLDINKFHIQILPFETDDDAERYKCVKQCVDDFIGVLGISVPGLGKQLLSIWQNEVFNNGLKSDANIQLNKKDIIWPIIVMTTNATHYDDSMKELFDPSIYDEIIHFYQCIIDSCCERYEFFSKVLYDYQFFSSDKSPSQKPIDFALSKWEEYSAELDSGIIECETLKGLTQIIL